MFHGFEWSEASSLPGAVPPVDAAPQIAITSGGGYAGSVYTSTVAGQWTADGSPISGATGTAYTMTLIDEGKAIRCGVSNTIEMWTFNDIPSAYRTNGGWWDPKHSQTLSGGKVASWPDQWGVRDMTQATGSKQPTSETVSGYPAAIWPDASLDTYLGPAAAFAPAFWLLVLRYKDGIDPAFGNYDALVTDGSSTNRVMGDSGTNQIYLYSGWAAVARKNGNAPEAPILPLAKSLVSFSGGAVATSWSLGRSRSSGDRAWKGPMFEALALGVAPDTTLRQQIEGCAAWRNGLQASLPQDHPYKSAAPRIA